VVNDDEVLGVDRLPTFGESTTHFDPERNVAELLAGVGRFEFLFEGFGVGTKRETASATRRISTTNSRSTGDADVAIIPTICGPPGDPGSRGSRCGSRRRFPSRLRVRAPTP
jgi:hypothetical protein